MPRIALALGSCLKGLHGKHRIAAAKKVLKGSDRWWPVDIYTDLDASSRLYLMDGFSNESRPSGGMIYQKVRRYTLEKNETFEKRWLSLFTNSERISYNALLKKKNWVAILDTLLGIPGLWHDMRLGNVRKLIRIKCDEEILNYLHRIKQFWLCLVTESTKEQVDRRTVLAVQVKAPHASRNDRRRLLQAYDDGEVFPFVEPAERSIIHAKLLETRGMVPSFDSFFNDCIYLKVIVDCLEWLISDDAVGTIRQRLEGCWVRSMSEDAPDHFHVAYKNLVVFAMRFNDKIPARHKTTNALVQAKAIPDQDTLYQFATLARRQGFFNESIRRLSNNGVTSYYEEDNFSLPVFQVSDDSRVVRNKERSGRPRMKDYLSEQRLLTLEALNSADEQIGNEITPLYVRRCFFQNFFVDANSDSMEHLDPSSHQRYNTRASQPTVTRSPYRISSWMFDTPANDMEFLITDVPASSRLSQIRRAPTSQSIATTNDQQQIDPLPSWRPKAGFLFYHYTNKHKPWYAVLKNGRVMPKTIQKVRQLMKYHVMYDLRGRILVPRHLHKLAHTAKGIVRIILLSKTDITVDHEFFRYAQNLPMGRIEVKHEQLNRITDAEMQMMGDTGGIEVDDEGIEERFEEVIDEEEEDL